MIKELQTLNKLFKKDLFDFTNEYTMENRHYVVEKQSEQIYTLLEKRYDIILKKYLHVELFEGHFLQCLEVIKRRKEDEKRT